ncbi:MAG: DUF4375 domain-containing protein [Myxococcales bacterium]
MARRTTDFDPDLEFAPGELERYLQVPKRPRSLRALASITDPVEFAGSLMVAIGCDDERKLTKLPQLCRLAVTVNAIELERSSGGFFQVIANSSPRVALDAVGFLREIGAVKTSRLLARAIARLPDGEVPRSSRAKAAILQAMEQAAGADPFRKEDAAFSRSGEDVLALLRAYVLSRPAALKAKSACAELLPKKASMGRGGSPHSSL